MSHPPLCLADMSPKPQQVVCRHGGTAKPPDSGATATWPATTTCGPKESPPNINRVTPKSKAKLQDRSSKMGQQEMQAWHEVGVQGGRPSSDNYEGPRRQAGEGWPGGRSRYRGGTPSRGQGRPVLPQVLPSTRQLPGQFGTPAGHLSLCPRPKIAGARRLRGHGPALGWGGGTPAPAPRRALPAPHFATLVKHCKHAPPPSARAHT